jgi:hypothetical protein
MKLPRRYYPPNEVPVAEGRDEWVRKARRYIKRELKQSDVTYEELASRLREMGIDETTSSVGAKIGRGLFPTWFFFATMKAIGSEEFRLKDLR